MEKESILERLSSQGANQNQIFLVNTAFDYGLTEEEMNVLADIAFNTKQMEQIFGGFKSGLTLEKVSTYAEIKEGKPVYNAAQMEELRRALEDGMEIKELLNPKFSARTMAEVRKTLELSKEETKRDSKKETSESEEEFNLSRTLEIVRTQYERIQELDNEYRLLNEFIREQLKEKTGEVKSLQEQLFMRDKEIAALKGMLETKVKQKEQKELQEPKGQGGKEDVQEQKKDILDPPDVRDTRKMQEPRIHRPIQAGYGTAPSFLKRIQGCFQRTEIEKIRLLLSNPKLTPEQMEQIRIGFEHGLPYEDVYVYAKESIAAGLMEQIRLTLELKKGEESYVPK